MFKSHNVRIMDGDKISGEYHETTNIRYYF